MSDIPDSTTTEQVEGECRPCITVWRHYIRRNLRLRPLGYQLNFQSPFVDGPVAMDRIKQNLCRFGGEDGEDGVGDTAKPNPRD